MQRQPGSVFKDAVCGEERCPDVDCRGCDPKVVGVTPIVERMTDAAAGESQLGSWGEQLVADGHDGGGLDRFFQALAPGLAPPGDKCRSGVR